jgi:hypothetical protein
MLLVVLLALALATASGLALAAIKWRRAFVMALPFVVILNGVAIPLGDASIRAEQLVSLLLAVPLAAPLLVGVRRLRLDPVCWWLGAILALNVVSSVMHSPVLGYSLVQCANLASVWFIYVLTINFLETRADLEAFLRSVVWAGIAGTGIAIAAFGLASVGLEVGGAEVSATAAQRLTNAYGAYGTMVEPNILGSFAASHLVLAAGLFAAQWRHMRTLRVLAVCCAVALVLSFTRAAWLGALAGLLAVGVTAIRSSGRQIHTRRILLPLGIALVLGVVLLMVPGSTGTLFRYKLLNLVNPATPTGIQRLLTYAMAIEQTTKHWVLGWGTYTFAPLVAEGADFQRFENWRNLWIGNYLLLALHDTGVLGLLLWIGLLWTVLSNGVLAARRATVNDPTMSGIVVALAASVATLLVPFLTTTGFSLGYPWLLIGLLGAYRRLVVEPESVVAPAVVQRPRLSPLPADAS